MTGLSVSQLVLLHKHFHTPEIIRNERSRRCFTGEEAFLHYVTYNRLGLTKLQLSLYHFSDDPRRFTYNIRAVHCLLFGHQLQLLHLDIELSFDNIDPSVSSSILFW